MSNKNLAKAIMENIGGEENVRSLVHCATRLRFKLRDNSKANREALDDIPEVLSVVEQGGQFQVVIGNKVSKVYQSIMDNYAIRSADGEASSDGRAQEKKGGWNKIFEYISGTFSPLIPAMTGAGMIKALLAVLSIFSLIDTEGATYAVLNAASSGFFTLLPIFVGVTAAKQLNANPFVGGAIAAALLDPSYTALLEVKEGLHFMGIPLVVTDYASTVFPILLAMALYAPLERFLKKHTPDTISLFFVPMMGILIMVPLTVLAFGPFAQYASGLVGQAINALVNFSGILGGILISGVWPFLVILGVHWGVVPLMIENFAKGGDIINPITAAATFAQTGIAFGIFLRSHRNKQLKSLALSASTSGILAGVTEPILYGLVLRYRRLIPLMVIASMVGGAIVGVFDVRVFTFVFNSVLTIPSYSPILGYSIGVGTSFVIATVLAFMFGTGDNKTETKESSTGETKDATSSEMKIEITAPLKGEVIPLEQVNDSVFSSGAMGKGLAIKPSEGKVYAPFDGKVVSLFPTQHAIGLVSTDGVELLIHIGLDTVQLEGQYFDAKVSVDQEFQAGDLLLSFNKDKIAEAGYDTVTPVIVTNSGDYMDVFISEGPVDHTNRVMTLV
ncbi:PTS beta-glucoside transporter subunit EIIBCA [Aerococcus sanguinicola]|uniref:PTS system sucrose-specific EIIBCA component n=1 Tax=Aerococcus sanguinicola TaxID=119206 RepID=A0A2I1MQ98_9LACT|nr:MULTISPECIES: beta-glucoside-specific PTS transporter subunit IIABC [Aerococcus]MDK7050074.1 beta-glucoside-specific PTS transporter subunit IIABC [Aerococcus sanguinicola]OFT93391.1 PTS beta-glucoside transporter subunit EIIBCA [Aerococcus sp. HMSC23C02]PKZ22324.1 PTS beta-glucoside transporter subunit EIIBCA [Aerococcus sanguinicola]